MEFVRCRSRNRHGSRRLPLAQRARLDFMGSLSDRLHAPWRSTPLRGDHGMSYRSMSWRVIWWWLSGRPRSTRRPYLAQPLCPRGAAPAALHRLGGGPHPRRRTTSAPPICGLPQARQTYAVLGHQPDDMLGLHPRRQREPCCGRRHRLAQPAPGGRRRPDRHRPRTARAGTRPHRAARARRAHRPRSHGMANAPRRTRTPPTISSFVADRKEAFVSSRLGRYWAVMECRQVRAVTDVALIRQEWQRLSPGLSPLAIDNGWWDGDGSKLDFAGCLDAQVPVARRRPPSLGPGDACAGAAERRHRQYRFYAACCSIITTASAAVNTHRPLAAGRQLHGRRSAGADEPVLAWCALRPAACRGLFPCLARWRFAGRLPGAMPMTPTSGSRHAELLALGRRRRRRTGAFERGPGTAAKHIRARRRGVPAAGPPVERQGESMHWQHQATALMNRHVACLRARIANCTAWDAEEAVPVAHEEFVSYISQAALCLRMAFAAQAYTRSSSIPRASPSPASNRRATDAATGSTAGSSPRTPTPQAARSPATAPAASRQASATGSSHVSQIGVSHISQRSPWSSRRSCRLRCTR